MDNPLPIPDPKLPPGYDNWELAIDFYIIESMRTWVRNPLIGIPFMQYGQMMMDFIFKVFPDLNDLPYAEEDIDTEGSSISDYHMSRRPSNHPVWEHNLTTAEFWNTNVAKALYPTVRQLLSEGNLYPGSLRLELHRYHGGGSSISGPLTVPLMPEFIFLERIQEETDG
jgi:hypothetical protein